MVHLNSKTQRSFHRTLNPNVINDHACSNPNKKKGKFPIKDRKKAKEKNSQSKIERKQKKKITNQGLRESKKERKFPIKHWRKTKEICRKVSGPDNI